MKSRRRTEISLELEEVVAIRTRRAVSAWCRRCQKRARMVSTEDATLITKLSAREIYRRVEAGRLHFTEDENGLLYICLASLGQLASEIDTSR